MHKSRLGCLIIDCQTEDLEAAAGFWSEALGCPVRRSSDPADENYIGLETPPDQLYMAVQKVDHPSRVHIDIETDDLEAEARRLEGLGAKRLKAVRTWIVMEAPTGQRFCIVRSQGPGFDAAANSWD